MLFLGLAQTSSLRFQVARMFFAFNNKHTTNQSQNGGRD